MQILKYFPHIIILIFVWSFISCTKNELESTPYNALDDSSVEIFQIDSFVTSTANGTHAFVAGYFRIKYELLKDTSLINNVIVYETSSFGTQIYSLHKSQRRSFVDINVSFNRDYTFTFALSDKNGNTSKKSKPYNVHVP